ncbi:MAG: hypothetical protein FYV88_1640 [Bacteroidetes bacterium]|nr:hypothetical protein [Bacteroidota bacterium]
MANLFHPKKNWIDSAVKYAEDHDVLIVHSAGNESVLLDDKPKFPNPWLGAWNRYANNFLTIGASSDLHITDCLTADFSNYSANLVDFFAPGVKIFSTQPSRNGYGRLDGTSFSGPIVAGIAALMRSYYPALTTTEIVQILQNTVTIPKDIQTCIPATGKDKTLTAWKSLSKTGGIVNAYQAIKAADEFNQLKAKPGPRLKK